MKTKEIEGKEYTVNDLVKFRIEAIDGDDPSKTVFMIFRAYLTDFSDSVNATWNDIKYAGRGEKFYIYDGFNRQISIGFKVAALSVDEMKPMYLAQSSSKQQALGLPQLDELICRAPQGLSSGIQIYVLPFHRQRDLPIHDIYHQ